MENLNNIILIVLASCVFIFATMLLFALRWARRQYPMHRPYPVFFVTHASTSGVDANTFFSVLKCVLIPACVAYGVLVCIYVAFLRQYAKALNKPHIIYFFTNGVHFFLVSLVYLLFVGCVIAVVLKAWRYLGISYAIHKKPEYSEFYEKNYVAPEQVKIAFPQKKRNLIVIFMESMESTFSSIEDGGVFTESCIPNLTALARENCNFSNTDKLGGAENLEGTSWTVAGILSKLSGLPYFAPFAKRDGKLTCIPHAVTLTDILQANGYRCVFSFGSEMRFENRDAFLEGHGIEIHDINWFKKNGWLPKKYQVFWGFEDMKLFDFARRELTQLGENDEPFFYAMLTVDTHFPNGYACPKCPHIFPRQIMNVLRCADMQIAELIAWMKKQAWWENTTVVITGDHNYLDAPKNNFIAEASPLYKKTEAQRKCLDIFVQSVKKCSQDVCKNRQFSSYDMFPTMLESIGCEIEGGALAFGRSLYSGKKTLVEQYGVQKCNEELMKRTTQYEELK